MQMVNNGWGYHPSSNKSSVLINRTKLLKTSVGELRLVTNYKLVVELSTGYRDFTRKNLKTAFIDNRTGLNLEDWLSSHAKELADIFGRSAIQAEINKRREDI
jgi:hypothetical protein|nr:MAG TPA: hypothetical protein [Caudoviricetes sp.]